MVIKISTSSLREGQWHEYLVRFALGGIATVVTGLIAASFGPAIGGLFLALPAIFCASATLVEKHEKRRMRARGLEGTRRGEEAAALDAAGAALGSRPAVFRGHILSAYRQRWWPCARWWVRGLVSCRN